MTHDDTHIETSEADARPWRGEAPTAEPSAPAAQPAAAPAPARWYCLSRIGMATLCLDEADANRTAATEDDLHPRNGPHRAVRMVEAASQPATAPAVPAGWREFVARVAAQKPEKPDYWSSCGQCVHNISDAEDLLAAAPAAPVVQPAAPSVGQVRFEGIDDTPQMMRVREVLAAAGISVTNGRLIADVVAASQPAAQPSAIPPFVGWYCAQCRRGVDASEVTYHEQHTECGRVITNDEPPAAQQGEAVATVRIDSGAVHIIPKVRDAEVSPLTDGQRLYAARPARQAVAQPDLIAAIKALPTVKAREFDGEESDGTPRSWRDRPHVSLTFLLRLLAERGITPAGS